MHGFNLLKERWLPVVTRRGRIETIALSELGRDDLLFPEWRRADLNIGCLELLVGVLAVAFAPKNLAQWVKLYKTPPGKEQLEQAFARFLPAFNLCGVGSLFLQDFNAGTDGADNPAEALFIDSAGVSTAKKNSDLMVHRQRYSALSPGAAAMALYTLQAFAPSGGAGNRVSLRGGGPWSVYAVPPVAGDAKATLWQLLWSNVPENRQGPVEANAFEQIFPWMAPTRSSAKSEKTDLNEHGHPLQAFFGMPRRIRLKFAGSIERCPLTGCHSETSVVGFTQRTYGVNYEDGPWHPLTPYYRNNPTEPFLSRKPKPGVQGYRTWRTLALGQSEGDDLPAKTLDTFVRRGAEIAEVIEGELGVPRILAGGWSMDNMTPVDFIIEEQPLHLARTEELRDALSLKAREMVKAAEEVAFRLRSAVKRAAAGSLIKDKQKAFDGIALQASDVFYTRTDDAFHHCLSQLAHQCTAAELQHRWLLAGNVWLEVLRKQALLQFDRVIKVPLHDVQRAEEVVRARGKLIRDLGKSLYKELGLTPPDKKEAAQ